MDATAARPKSSTATPLQPTPAPSKQPTAQIRSKNEPISKDQITNPRISGNANTGTFANKHSTKEVRGKQTNSKSRAAKQNLNESSKSSDPKKLSERSTAKPATPLDTAQQTSKVTSLDCVESLELQIKQYGDKIREILDFLILEYEKAQLSILALSIIKKDWKDAYKSLSDAYFKSLNYKKSFETLNIETLNDLSFGLIQSLYYFIEIWEDVKDYSEILFMEPPQESLKKVKLMEADLSKVEALFRYIIDEALGIYAIFRGSALKDFELIQLPRVIGTQKYLFYVNKNNGFNTGPDTNKVHISITYLFTRGPSTLKFEGNTLFYKIFKLGYSSIPNYYRQGVLFKKIDFMGHIEIVDTPGIIIGFTNLYAHFMYYNPKCQDLEESLPPYTSRTHTLSIKYESYAERVHDCKLNSDSIKPNIVEQFKPFIDFCLNQFPVRKEDKGALVDDMFKTNFKINEYKYRALPVRSSEISVDQVVDLRTCLLSLTPIQFKEYAYLLLNNLSMDQWIGSSSHPFRKALEQAFPSSTQSEIKQTIEASLEQDYVENYKEQYIKNPSQAIKDALGEIDKELETSIETISREHADTVEKELKLTQIEMPQEIEDTEEIALVLEYNQASSEATIDTAFEIDQEPEAVIENISISDIVIIDETFKGPKEEITSKDLKQNQTASIENQFLKQKSKAIARLEAIKLKFQSMKDAFRTEAEKKKENLFSNTAIKAANTQLTLLKKKIITSGPLKNIGDLTKALNAMTALLEGTPIKLSIANRTGSHMKVEVKNTNVIGNTHTTSSIIAMPHKNSARHSLQQGVVGILDNLIQETSI